MQEKTGYKTRQQAQIISYLSSVEEQHVTVSQIELYFKGQGISVGTTTIYRHLEKLQLQGLVRKYVTDGGGACYQYIGTECKESSKPHFHLKCTSCGCLLHMECDEIIKLKQHVLADHNFELQLRQTTFYGQCKDCRPADVEISSKTL